MTAETGPTLAFLDCETSGLSVWEGHRPWEVAAIVRLPDGGETEYRWQFRIDTATADPIALEKGRYDIRFALAPAWEAGLCDDDGFVPFTAWAAADDMRQVLHGVTLVGANIGFDREMLAALFHDHGLDPSWHYRPTCVENLVQAVHRLPVPPGLKDAADLMGVKYDPDELHSALADAKLARDVYDAVMAGGAQ